MFCLNTFDFIINAGYEGLFIKTGLKIFTTPNVPILLVKRLFIKITGLKGFLIVIMEFVSKMLLN